MALSCLMVFALALVRVSAVHADSTASQMLARHSAEPVMRKMSTSDSVSSEDATGSRRAPARAQPPTGGVRLATMSVDAEGVAHSMSDPQQAPRSDVVLAEAAGIANDEEENPAMLAALKLNKTSGCLGTESPKQQLHGEVLKSICENLGSSTFLVFGTGYDSPFWMESNPKGNTRFLEWNEEWVQFQPDQVKKAETTVHYTSKLATAMKDINNTDMLREFFDKQVPSDVKATKWNVILVDSPRGFRRGQPGRGQSIFAASLLAEPSTIIFVDDCVEHRVEPAYVQRYLVKNGRTLTILDDGHGGRTCRISAEEP